MKTITAAVLLLGILATSAQAWDHYIAKKSDDSQIIVLEDRTTWQVQPIDRVTAILWLPLTNVSIVDEGYTSTMVNTEDHETIEVRQIK